MLNKLNYTTNPLLEMLKFSTDQNTDICSGKHYAEDQRITGCRPWKLSQTNIVFYILYEYSKKKSQPNGDTNLNL